MSAAEDRFFCSLESQRNGEEIYGTVARIRSWFLLEYPGVWRRDAVEDSRVLSPTVKHHLTRGPWDRTLLIRQDHHWDRGELRAFTVNSVPDSLSISRHNFTDYERVPELRGPGEPVSGYMLAVCTHSRHDRCCAKFGTALWCALRETAPERAWQCSHVGGDRFAANVVLLPHGIYYGRVRPEDVRDLLEACDAGKIWLPGYRGRSSYSRPQQVAEYYLRRESGRVRFDDFAPVGATEKSGNLTAVTFAERDNAKLHRIEFQTLPDLWRQRLTCEAENESTVSQYRLINYSAR